MLLAGRVAIVTGAGRGIGRGIALRFAAEGAAVLVTARTESEVRRVAAEIAGQGGKSAWLVADVAEEGDCSAIVAAAHNELGPVNVLVNNAGDYGPVKPIEEISPAEWDRIVAVHLRGAFLLMRLLLPGMYARGNGAIVNISSLSAKSAFSWGSPYAAAKAGILGLTRVAAAEAARRGVRVNAICPGPVTETKMSQDLGRALGARLGMNPDAQLAEFLKNILQGRGQTVEEIAAVAAFLASDQASAITGQSVNVDGGAAFY
jgi:meso-butanediol dehydrogenase / (S,S)-butanediol dehydrogenase / diacetyl reductase